MILLTWIRIRIQSIRIHFTEKEGIQGNTLNKWEDAFIKREKIYTPAEVKCDDDIDAARWEEEKTDLPWRSCMCEICGKKFDQVVMLEQHREDIDKITNYDRWGTVWKNSQYNTDQFFMPHKSNGDNWANFIIDFVNIWWSFHHFQISKFTSNDEVLYERMTI